MRLNKWAKAILAVTLGINFLAVAAFADQPLPIALDSDYADTPPYWLLQIDRTNNIGLRDFEDVGELAQKFCAGRGRYDDDTYKLVCTFDSLVGSYMMTRLEVDASALDVPPNWSGRELVYGIFGVKGDKPLAAGDIAKLRNLIFRASWTEFMLEQGLMAVRSLLMQHLTQDGIRASQWGYQVLVQSLRRGTRYDKFKGFRDVCVCDYSAPDNKNWCMWNRAMAIKIQYDLLTNHKSQIAAMQASTRKPLIGSPVLALLDTASVFDLFKQQAAFLLYRDDIIDNHPEEFEDQLRTRPGGGAYLDALTAALSKPHLVSTAAGASFVTAAREALLAKSLNDDLANIESYAGPLREYQQRFQHLSDETTKVLHEGSDYISAGTFP